MSDRDERRPPHRSAPLVPVAVAAALGVIADRFAVAWPTSTWAAIALAAAVAGVLLRQTAGLGAVAILAAYTALGGGWHHHRWSDLAADDLARGDLATPRPAWLRGVLAEVPEFTPGPSAPYAGVARAILDVTGTCDGRDWHRASGRVQLVVAGGPIGQAAGTAVQAAGSLATVPGPLNPGEFDSRAFLRGQGLRLRLAVEDNAGIWPDPESPGSSWSGWAARGLGRVRAWSHARLVAGLEPRVAPLATALLLGRREALDPAVNDAFARTGTTHLLAISGLHLQVLAGALWVVCRALGVRRPAAWLTVGGTTIVYAALVGLAPSVVRATVMTLAICLAGLCHRPVRSANLLALAALATLLLNPAHLFDAGCQLSFLAVAAIFWGVGPLVGWWERRLGPLDRLERRLRPRWQRFFYAGMNTVSEGLAVSVVVWLVTLPLVCLRFHLVAPIAILVNVPLVPLTSLALMAAGLSLGMSAVWGPLGRPAGWACGQLLSWTETVVRWGAGQSWGHRFEPGPPLAWVLAFYGLLVLAFAATSRRRRGARWTWGLVGAWTAVGVTLSLSPRRPGTLEADVLAVGHGLAVVIQGDDGRATLYDCGRMNDPGIGRRVIAPALWARGVRRLEAVVLSHADADHYNGLADLLPRFSIAAVRVPPGFGAATNPGAARLLSAVRARGVTVATIAAGDRWPLGRGATAAVLHPPRGWAPTSPDNARSVVLDCEHSGHGLLLTGDIDEPGLAELLGHARGPVDALLAPHHGGRSANPPRLYQWARPGVVLVSQRRPAAEARDPLALVAARGMPVLRTWERGAIRLHWGESGLTARGFLDPPEDSPVTLSLGAIGASGWSRGLVAVIGLLVGTVLWGVCVVVEWGAWALVMPRRKGVESEGAGGEPIEARAGDGVRLVGTWYAAAGGGTGRTALLLHGFGESRGALRDRAAGLVHLGWNLALLDARAHGQSGGHHVSFGAREAGDVSAWLDALAGRIGAGEKAAVWGRSMGAAVALRAAAEDDRIGALVLEAPYPDLSAAVAAWLDRMKIPGALAGLLLRRAARLAGVAAHRPRPVELAPRVAVPALILHGSDDPIVPLADARRLADAFPTPARLIEVPRARHVDLLDVAGPALIEQVARFLEGGFTARTPGAPGDE